jgi:hypothetical protein
MDRCQPAFFAGALPHRGLLAPTDDTDRCDVLLLALQALEELAGADRSTLFCARQPANQ